MRAQILIPILAIACSTSTLSAQGTAVGGAEITVDSTKMSLAERAVLHLEMRRTKAVADHDTAALKSIYASDFRGITPIGVALDRAQLLDEVVHDDPSLTSRVDEVAIRILDAARTSAMLTARTRMLSGSRTQAMFRSMQIYQMRDGRWQIVAAQATSIVAR